MNIKWDAKGYTDNFSFVHQYGNALLDLIDVQPGMTCLDLGCGNGALTAELSQIGLSVTGLDASPELLKIARAQHPDLQFVQGDAADFSLKEPVDVIFSNAVFHWIDAGRQENLLSCIYRALRPGGQLIFEFGGKGNNALIHRELKKAFERRGLTYRFPFYFPSIGEYTMLMEHAGLQPTYALLFDRLTPLNGDDGLYDWIQMFVKTPFAGVTEQVKEEIIREAVEALFSKLFLDGKWHADYVRIRCKASR